MLQKILITASLTLICTSSYAFNFPTICPSASEYHRVSGNIQTKNLNQYEQTGRVLFNVYSTKRFKKRLKFSDSGSVHGTITSQQDISITLNHEITMDESLAKIYTYNDKAIITGITALAKDLSGELILNPQTHLPTPCGFSVIERITDISGSTGIFKNATGKITAIGTINACPQNQTDEIHNRFVLKGYVCLQK